jgi:hypothetical protein
MSKQYFEYADAIADDERVIEINCLDSERVCFKDPFDIVSEYEEETGCPLVFQ